MPQADGQGEIRRAATVDRRRFLTVSGAAPGALHSDPFALGIASGDPLPDAVVL
jgi:phosphodiesterase/alkaline phosphatase D-like protein